jgi:hypothetical protein
MLTCMRILFRAVLVIAAAVFMASLAFVGVILALAYPLWCLLRGQRPQWPSVFMGPLRHMQRRQRWPAAPQGGYKASSGHAGVVEGQARELN